MPRPYRFSRAGRSPLRGLPHASSRAASVNAPAGSLFPRRRPRALEQAFRPPERPHPPLLLRDLLPSPTRSEEHTSELQSHSDLVCRLLLEKKKKQKKHNAFVSNVSKV